jgi:hypothetical protein
VPNEHVWHPREPAVTRVGTLLFVLAVVGNAVALALGLAIGFVTIARRALLAGRERRLLAVEHDSAFHHPDHIRTAASEWLFMAVAFVAVLIGLPVVLSALFQFVVPALGRAWGP